MPVSKFISRLVGEKRKWRNYKERVKMLPLGYRTAIEGFERYLMHLGGGAGGTAIFEDLIDLFEQSAANEVPIQRIVGEDPVEFIETFVRNYSRGDWVTSERERLVHAIERATRETEGET